MKIDVVIYSEKIAIGLFWFTQWYDTPTVLFIYEAKNYPGNTNEVWDNDILEKIKSFGEIKEMNEILATSLKKNAQIGDQIQKNYYQDVARIYSNGYTEAKAKNKILATVQDKTESLFELYKSLEIPVIFELNKGNHFTEAALRTAKGIKWILEQ